MANVLEEGEIDSEHEALLDFNNEGVIDQIIKKENGSQKKVSPQESSRNKRAQNRSKTTRRIETTRKSTSLSSWRSINNTRNPERLRRPPPPDSVMFPGLQNSPIQSRSSQQSFYPAAQQPPTFNFFNPPPPPLQFAGPPPPPHFTSQHHQISSKPNGSYRGGNFDEVRMEITDDRKTPDEPTLPPNTSRPVHIPLDVLLPPPPPPPVLQDDADALRQMLLSQMTLKRGASEVKTSASKRKKSSSISKMAEPEKKAGEPAPAPAPTAAAVPARAPTPAAQSPQSPSPSPAPPSQLAQPEAQSSLEKQTELGNQIQTLEVFIKDSQNSIRQEHEELKTLTARCKFLKDSMSKRRIEIKEAAVKKRDFQNQLEALDDEELDILCDDVIFEQMFRPATASVIPVKPEPTPTEPEVTTPKPEKPEQVAPPVAPLAPPPAPPPVPPPAPQVVSQPAPQPVAQPALQPPGRHQKSVEVINDEAPQTISSASEDSEIEDSEDLEDRVDGEQEDEEEEDIEVIVPANSGLNEELSLREKLLAKCGKSRQSPEVLAVVTSSSPDRVLSCRNFLLTLCKFELNGTCTRGRECTFLHLVNITDETEQRLLLEGLLREVLAYKERDIESAISDVFAFLPRFEHFEKLIHYFLTIVMKRSPNFRSRLFEFFANGR